MKRGNFTAAENAYVAKHWGSKPASDIARRLDRPLATIERKGAALSTKAAMLPPAQPEPEVAAEVSDALRRTLEWKAIRKEFVREELDLFEEKYVRTIAHLRDLTPMEVTQVHQQLKYEVLMHRNLVARAEARKDAERMRGMQKKLVEDNPNNNTAAFRDQLIAIEQQIQSLVSAEQSRTKEYVDLQKQHADLAKALKTTRDQRIKNLEEQASKASFVSLLKLLEDGKAREAEGRFMELSRIAGENALAEMGEEAQFPDGTVDRPILTPDTVDQPS